MPRFWSPSGSLLLGAALLVGVQISSPTALAAPDAGNQFVAQPEVGQPADEIGKGYFTLALKPGEAVFAVLKSVILDPRALRVVGALE